MRQPASAKVRPCPPAGSLRPKASLPIWSADIFNTDAVSITSPFVPRPNSANASAMPFGSLTATGCSTTFNACAPECIDFKVFSPPTPVTFCLHRQILRLIPPIVWLHALALKPPDDLVPIVVERQGHAHHDGREEDHLEVVASGRMSPLR